MEPAFKDFYAACIALVTDLVELDPAADSPEGKLLIGLATAIEEYEKIKIQELLRHP